MAPKTDVVLSKTAAISAQKPPALPRKFCPWMTEVAISVVSQGRPMKYVADTLGISLATLERWRALGADDRCTDSDLQAFSLGIAKARAESVGDLVDVMRGHAQNDWRAAARLLEVIDPDVWVVTTKTKSDVTVTAAAPVSLEGLTDEELEWKDRIEAKMAARAALPA